MSMILAFIKAAVIGGTPLLFGTSGEILTEKSGNLNLGVEGIMYMGGAFGLAGAFLYGNAAGESASGVVAVILAIVCSFIAGCLASLIFSFVTISLRANQNVTGLALTMFGTGVGQFTGEYMRMKSGGYVAIANNLKVFFEGPCLPAALRNIPVLGDILFSYNFFVYLGLVMALAMGFVLNKTRVGLYLRSVGENPATADAAGINVEKYKYLATICGGGISAIGGMVYIMTTAGCVWNHMGLSGVGWLSVALVIFCLWKPFSALYNAIVFGGLTILYLYMHIAIPAQIYKILPYIVTVIVLILVSIRQKRENQPPASLGIAYFREDR